MNDTFVYLPVTDDLKLSITFELLAYVKKSSIVDSKFFYNDTQIEDFKNHNPLIVKYFKDLGITIRHAGFLVASVDNPLHYDEPRLNLNTIRMNWPVLNCENSKTKLYSVKDQGKLVYAKNGVAGTVLDPSTATYITEFDLSVGPVAWYAYRYGHSVHIGHNTPRISLTCWFHENVEFLFK